MTDGQPDELHVSSGWFERSSRINERRMAKGDHKRQLCHPIASIHCIFNYLIVRRISSVLSTFGACLHPADAYRQTVPAQRASSILNSLEFASGACYRKCAYLAPGP
jgi:hypothetical protein